MAHEINALHLAQAAVGGTLHPMFDVASHGGSVDRSVGGFPLRTILSWVAMLCALLFAMLWGNAVHAGTLYKCVGASGETVFSSSKVGYQKCKVISTYAPAPPVVRKAPPKPREALTGVTGSVVTSARNLAAEGAMPTSLASVVGSATTTARSLATPIVEHASLASVHGSAQTSAKPPVVATTNDAAHGPAGKWTYQESRRAAQLDAAASTKNNRVLSGAVYRIVRPDGSVEYTNLRPASLKGRVVKRLFSYIATCYACNLNSTIRWGRVSLNLTAYADSIRAASVEYGVDEAFLRAIIHAESAFNPNALSLKGAQGLMQLMPGTASDMGVLDAFDSNQNIHGGARYLSLLLQNFHGDERLAAAAYNAGPGAVQKYSGVPPYAETQVYVERVETLRKRYGEAIHPPLAAIHGPG